MHKTRLMQEQPAPLACSRAKPFSNKTTLHLRPDGVDNASLGNIGIIALVVVLTLVTVIIRVMTRVPDGNPGRHVILTPAAGAHTVATTARRDRKMWLLGGGGREPGEAR